MYVLNQNKYTTKSLSEPVSYRVYSKSLSKPVSYRVIAEGGNGKFLYRLHQTVTLEE